jgi:hypothetical protein
MRSHPIAPLSKWSDLETSIPPDRQSYTQQLRVLSPSTQLKKAIYLSPNLVESTAQFCNRNACTWRPRTGAVLRSSRRTSSILHNHSPNDGHRSQSCHTWNICSHPTCGLRRELLRIWSICNHARMGFIARPSTVEALATTSCVGTRPGLAALSTSFAILAPVVPFVPRFAADRLRSLSRVEYGKQEGT